MADEVVPVRSASSSLNISREARPHIVLVVARGEAVRNFLFSETLPILSQHARVTLLSLVDHGEVAKRAEPFVEQIVPLPVFRENSLVTFFREILLTAHYRWLSSEAVKFYWGRHNARVKGNRYETLKLLAGRALAYPLANLPMLQWGTQIDRSLSWHLRPSRDFEKLFSGLQPDLVFNCSHIHGPKADLPLRIAHGMGIKTAAFVFSWDNLTSRSRILVPYNYFLVWTAMIKQQFLDFYPEVNPAKVVATDTPQFDFHFDSRFWLSRKDLCQRVGLDPSRSFILYSTGRDVDFPEEQRIVAAVVDFLKTLDAASRPQLLVRTYIKGTSAAMLELAESLRSDPDVVFPSIHWDKQWTMPLYEDLYIYTNLLRHTALGINAASTVSLELMMLDKPVINLGFEPPGSNLPNWSRFARHIDYDHYRPVAASGGVMVARSLEDLKHMIVRGLSQPDADREARRHFITSMFGEAPDGKAGERIAHLLVCWAKAGAAPCLNESPQ